MQYTNHSGGAKGADWYWKSLGGLYGVVTIDWRPDHINYMNEDDSRSMYAAVKNAAKALGRPTEFSGIGLVMRNWFQAHHAQAIYAIGHIVPPGQQDFKGFTNETGKQIVAGGTGWAVEMAIQMNKRVYVFNMGEEGTERWYVWNHDHNKFWPTFTPILTEQFAGIGSRIISPEGIQAIKDVYEKTFDQKEGDSMP